MTKAASAPARRAGPGFVATGCSFARERAKNPEFSCKPGSFLTKGPALFPAEPTKDAKPKPMPGRAMSGINGKTVQTVGPPAVKAGKDFNFIAHPSRHFPF